MDAISVTESSLPGFEFSAADQFVTGMVDEFPLDEWASNYSCRGKDGLQSWWIMMVIEVLTESGCWDSSLKWPSVYRTGEQTNTI